MPILYEALRNASGTACGRRHLIAKYKRAEAQEKRIGGEQLLRPPPVRLLRIVGVASGAGAPDQRCAQGPGALQAGGLISRLQSAGLDAAWSATLAAPAGNPRSAITLLATSLARCTHELALNRFLPVVLGGDHSCAIGTWKGIARAHAPRGPLGLVWIDAHMDAHTPETTASGMLHGMPVACLLGYGDPRLTAIAGNMRLDPQRLCLVGVRSFESGEAALLRRLGVRVFFMHEVARRGLRPVLEEAIAIAGHRTAGFGVSLDLDAIDPIDAPGVCSAVRGGIRTHELLPALSLIARERGLAGVEIAEYNPHRDRGGATARLVGEILESLLEERQARSAPATRSGSEESCTAPLARRRAA